MLGGHATIPVLVIPADRQQPLAVKEIAEHQFEQVLGGPVSKLRPLVTDASPMDWQIVVAKSALGGRSNARAQMLSTQLGGSPSKTLRGDVIVCGWAVGGIARPVPGIVVQLARGQGWVVKSPF